jgi:hypothetical protein
MSQSISEYINNKQARLLSPWRYIGSTGQSGYLLDNGILASDEHIKEMYPISDKLEFWDFYHKGDNPDKTRII